MAWFGRVWLWLLLLGLAASPAIAQDPADRINVFFDCQTGGCRDFDYFRREITFVNWMRDREDADVHVLVTSQGTGGGGRFYRMSFLVLRSDLGDDHELTVATPADATGDEQRDALARRLGLGLVAHVESTSLADLLTVTFEGDPTPDATENGESSAQATVDDPWDYWVFRINANGNGNGQTTSSFLNWSSGISANRTTEAWKISVSGRFFMNVQSFDFTDADGVTRTVEERREDWRTSSSLVRSVGEQWALGVRAAASSSTLLNQDLTVSLHPGVEFDFFPYSESSRRSLTLQYLIGPTHFRYAERTIFDHTEETRLQESLTARLSLIAPWGRWSTSLHGAHYLHDIEKSSLTLSGNVNVRLFRGFSINASANYSWIRDQLYLSAEGATSEQVLLRQRQLETSFRYFYSFGIQYQFGSIFNNVVNPRFGDGGDVVFFF